MRRREFLSAVGAVGLLTATSPRLAFAQPNEMPLIAWLSVTGSDDPLWGQLLGRGLATQGFTLGTDVRLETVNVVNTPIQIAAGAADILALEPDIIIAGGTERTEALLTATDTIPIVFNNVDDPGRLVGNPDRPEGNATGFWIGDRPVEARIESLRMLMPEIDRLIYLFHLDDEVRERLADYEAGARAAGLQFVPVGVFDVNEIELVLAGHVGQPATGLLISAGGVFYDDRPAVIRAVNATRIPASFFWSQYAEGGGLMSISPDIYDPIRNTGIYVGRILNGEPIANLPVQPPSKYRLTLNLATARAQGIAVPAALRDNADVVIG